MFYTDEEKGKIKQYSDLIRCHENKVNKFVNEIEKINTTAIDRACVREKEERNKKSQEEIELSRNVVYQKFFHGRTHVVAINSEMGAEFIEAIR